MTDESTQYLCLLNDFCHPHFHSVMEVASSYKETSRKLLIAFDVGTTYSGISFWSVCCHHWLTRADVSCSILQAGLSPEIKSVNKCVDLLSVYGNLIKALYFRFPSQDATCGSIKIPSVLYYDVNGVVQAVGAETLAEGMSERAEEAGWTRAEWYEQFLQPH